MYKKKGKYLIGRKKERTNKNKKIKKNISTKHTNTHEKIKLRLTRMRTIFSSIY